MLSAALIELLRGMDIQPFCQYYSIGVQDSGAAGADRKPGKENGLTGRQEGPHSVFGIIAQAMERFGRTKRHIL